MALLIKHEARVEQHITELRAQQEHLRDKIAWYRAQLPVQPT
ncbi:hypothetical protein [Actinacidiphila oryziradicis]|nr:hypothetical protein [Actinacidiphila oryziradicis]